MQGMPLLSTLMHVQVLINNRLYGAIPSTFIYFEWVHIWRFAIDLGMLGVHVSSNI